MNTSEKTLIGLIVVAALIGLFLAYESTNKYMPPIPTPTPSVSTTPIPITPCFDKKCA